MESGRPSPPPSPPTPPPWRLWAALVCSVVLHLLMLFLSERGDYTAPPRAVTPPVLATLRIATAVAPMPSAPSPPRPDEPPAAGGHATPEIPPAFTQPARFAVPPDFSPLQALPLVGPVRLRLRLHVSALGTLTRVEVLETDGVTGEFLATVQEQLEIAHYTWALAGSDPVPASFEILIKARPDPVELGQSPEGNAKVTASE